MDESDGGLKKMRDNMDTRCHAFINSVAKIISKKVEGKVPGVELVLNDKKVSGDLIYLKASYPSAPGDPLIEKVKDAADAALKDLSVESNMLDALKKAGFFDANS